MEDDFNRCDMCRAKLCGFSPPVDLTPTTALFPCLHALCPSCKTKCEEASTNQQTLVCQVCRTECLRSHVLDVPNANDCGLKRCESAVCPDKHQATTRCITCSEALCADCSLAHQRVTATSFHFLQTLGPPIPNCLRCHFHSNMRIVSLCQCGSYVCMTCIASRSHDGPSHMTTPLTHFLPNAHVDESKIMSSAVRETAHIDCSLSMVQVRKNALAERIVNLKKEVGNQVVQICQAVMRRGNDLLRALDAVHFYKEQEYDKLREELLWQKQRFSRISLYASRVKNFDDPTALVVMKQFLENCIRVIKAKKVSSERSLNGLQRPAAVQFKPNSDHLLAIISQWGRIFAEADDSGSPKTVTVEVTPTPPSYNLLDVPLFDTSSSGVRRSCSNVYYKSTNVYPFRPCTNGAVRPNSSTSNVLRPPMSHEEARLLQQQFRVQELAARQMQNARRAGLPHSPVLGSVSTENPQRPGSIQLHGTHRYPASYPCTPGITTPERPYAAPYGCPVGQILPYGGQRMLISNSVPAQQSQATNLVEALNDIHRVPNVHLSTSQSGNSVTGVPFGSGTAANLLLRNSEETLIQTAHSGIVSSSSMSSSGATSACTKQLVTSSTAVTADNQHADSTSSSVMCSPNTTTPIATERPSICPVSVFSNPSIRTSTPQSKCTPSSSGAGAGACVSSPPPKDPEPAPLKMTISIKRNSSDTAADSSTAVASGHDQSKPADPEQTRTEDEEQIRADGLTDNNASRWDDYCYVCQQGCDDRTGLLGCCARCPRVFHNFCHIPAIKERMESLPDEWACSLCVDAEPLQENTGMMGQRERLLCSKVLLSCYEKHLDVEPFYQPVPKNVVSYHLIIKQPMDFSTIARRLKEKSKDPFTNVLQFIQSMNLVFENCSTFNAPNDEIAKAGRSVYQIYSQAVKNHLPCMKNHVWLYVNKYSESRHAGLMQKEQSASAPSSSTSLRETTSAEPVNKKPRKEVKSEFTNEFT